MKTFLYLLLAVAVLVLAAWFYLKSGSAVSPRTNAPTNTTNSAIGTGAQAGAAAKAAVPGAIGNTNPFKSNVNPVSGYQNPFGR